MPDPAFPVDDLIPVSSESDHTRISQNADLNMRIIQSLIWFVENNFGEEKLESLSFESGVPLDKLRACKSWISLEQTESILHFVRELTGSDESFAEACTYRMKESYGPLRFLLWATTPSQMLESGQKHFSSISTFSSGDFIKLKDGSFKLRYYSSQPESRLMCLSRQAQSASLPLLWDLPKASLRETSCICNGDDHCEYEVSVYGKSRVFPVVAGGLIGALASVAVLCFDALQTLASTYLWGVTPLLGGAIGYILELRRANRRNLSVADDINKGLSQVVVENQQTQQEILKLNQRQKDWNRRLEEQVNMRSRSSEALTKKVQTILEEQTSALKGVSHDMKNPLTVILQTAEIIGMDLDAKSVWMIEEQKQAVNRIRILLDDMLQLETRGISAMQFMPESVATKPLELSLRRRLRALAGDRGLRISVISTRETPECILIDKVLLDRVMDNLLTNAVKYTEKGSIVLEMDGKPGFMTIKLSDTGRGIAQEDMKKVFSAGGSNPETREEFSHGLGLSVVVKLLDRIGGKLEVMSLPGRGSTFWVHFPVEPSEKSEDEPSSGVTASDPTNRVVTIRRVV